MHRSIIATLMNIVRNEGCLKLFSGIGPRVLWISIGGSIFFGVYEESKKLIGLCIKGPPDSSALV
jgi:solute carrier family 25 S-adenosylmethionine transporter 26